MVADDGLCRRGGRRSLVAHGGAVPGMGFSAAPALAASRFGDGVSFTSGMVFFHGPEAMVADGGWAG